MAGAAGVTGATGGAFFNGNWVEQANSVQTTKQADASKLARFNNMEGDSLCG
jgi:hypothetical protein